MLLSELKTNWRCLFLLHFREILHHEQRSYQQEAGRGTSMTHEQIWASQSFFLLLLLFVLILKAWHWQINNLSLGFQMSQQSLSSHADVSVGSDVCNSIGESESVQFWPLTPGQALHPLISHETWCKATEFKCCQASWTSEQSCRCPQRAPQGHDTDKSQNMSLWLMLAIVLLFLWFDLFFLPIYLSFFLSVCLLVFLSFMVERTCLWLSCRPQTLPPALVPFRCNPLNLSLF